MGIASVIWCVVLQYKVNGLTDKNNTVHGVQEQIKKLDAAVGRIDSAQQMTAEIVNGKTATESLPAHIAALRDAVRTTNEQIKNANAVPKMETKIAEMQDKFTALDKEKKGWVTTAGLTELNANIQNDFPNNGAVIQQIQNATSALKTTVTQEYTALVTTGTDKLSTEIKACQDAIAQTSSTNALAVKTLNDGIQKNTTMIGTLQVKYDKAVDDLKIGLGEKVGTGQFPALFTQNAGTLTSSIGSLEASMKELNDVPKRISALRADVERDYMTKKGLGDALDAKKYALSSNVEKLATTRITEDRANVIVDTAATKLEQKISAKAAAAEVTKLNGEIIKLQEQLKPLEANVKKISQQGYVLPADVQTSIQGLDAKLAPQLNTKATKDDVTKLQETINGMKKRIAELEKKLVAPTPAPTP